MRGLKTLMAAAAIAATILPAAASEQICPIVAPEKWMSMDAAAEIGRGLGYDVSYVQPDGGCWTVYAKKDGANFELFLNPETGELIRTERGS